MHGDPDAKARTVPAAGSLPGWYPDPFGRFPTRWWDGEAWTAYATDGEVRWDVEVFNQDDETVARYDLLTMSARTAA